GRRSSRSRQGPGSQLPSAEISCSSPEARSVAGAEPWNFGIVHIVDLAHDAVGRKLNEERFRKREDLHLVGPDLALHSGKLVHPVRRPDEVEDLIGGGLAALELGDVLLSEPLLDGNQPAVGADARRVGSIAVRHPRKPQDCFAVRPGALVRRGAHDRLDLGRARLAGHEPATGIARATRQDDGHYRDWDDFHVFPMASITLRAGSTRTQSPLRNTWPGCGVQPAVIGMPANTAPCTITGSVTPNTNALGASFFHLMPQKAQPAAMPPFA